MDLTAYELPTFKKQIQKLSLKNKTPYFLPKAAITVIYNVHNVLTNSRLLLFTFRALGDEKLKTVSDLYPNANWLEREVAELYGFLFDGKKDTRNLMLPYGDNSAPFQKFYPAVGKKELFFSALWDFIVDFPVSLQT